MMLVTHNIVILIKQVNVHVVTVTRNNNKK